MECEHAWCETLDNKQICNFCGEKRPPDSASSVSHTEEPKYLCLKLNKKIDPLILLILIHDFEQKVCLHDDSKNNFTWNDLAEILLQTDGSWDKKPYLYNKYQITKERPPDSASSVSHTDWSTDEHMKIDLENGIKIATYDEPIIVEKSDLKRLISGETPLNYDFYVEMKKKYLGDKE